jgi:hypothetical protein
LQLQRDLASKCVQLLLQAIEAQAVLAAFLAAHGRGLLRPQLFGTFGALARHQFVCGLRCRCSATIDGGRTCSRIRTCVTDLHAYQVRMEWRAHGPDERWIGRRFGFCLLQCIGGSQRFRRRGQFASLQYTLHRLSSSCLIALRPLLLVRPRVIAIRLHAASARLVVRSVTAVAGAVGTVVRFLGA